MKKWRYVMMSGLMAGILLLAGCRSADDPQIEVSPPEETTAAETEAEEEPTVIEPEPGWEEPVVAEYLLWSGRITAVREDGITYEVTAVDNSYEAAMGDYGTKVGDSLQWSFEGSLQPEDDEGGSVDPAQITEGMTVEIYNRGVTLETDPPKYPIHRVVIY